MFFLIPYFIFLKLTHTVVLEEVIIVNKNLYRTLKWSQVTVKSVKIYIMVSILSSITMVIIRNVSWASNQHIRMISEWSCDTEDWKSHFCHHRIKLPYCIFYSIVQSTLQYFWSNKCSLKAWCRQVKILFNKKNHPLELKHVVEETRAHCNMQPYNVWTYWLML